MSHTIKVESLVYENLHFNARNKLSENAAQAGLGFSVRQAIAVWCCFFMWFTTWKITCPKALILQLSYLNMS